MDTPRVHRTSWNEPHHAHELTFSTFRRKQFLTLPNVAKTFLASLDEARNRAEIDIYAFVIMPEHCHILVKPRNEDYQMSKILKSIKSQAAKDIFKAEPTLRPILAAHRPSRGTEYHVWQRGGGYDRNIFKTKTIWDVIRYIHANPVRRKLCEGIYDWPWSSAASYDGREAPIPIDLCDWYDDLAKLRNTNLW